MADNVNQVNADWEHSPHQDGKRRSPFTVIAVVLSLVALIASAWAFGTRAPSESDVTSTTILNSFEDVAELATQEYSFSGVGQFSDSGYSFFGWDVPFTGKSFLVTYRGVVTAGIDFGKVDVRVDDDAQIITVRAVAPAVLSAAIDPNSVDQYDQSFNPINQLSVDDVTTFLAQATDSHRQEAIDGGLLERAEQQAELLLMNQVESTIRGTELEDYDIKFQWKRTQ